jgi:hypothetical protein
MRRCAGLRSRLSYFSITGVELRAPSASLPPNLRDSSRQSLYDAHGWGKSDKTLAGYKLADVADEALGQSSGNPGMPLLLEFVSSP